MSESGSDLAVSLNSERPIRPEQLMKLYATEPWWPERSLDDITYILNTHISAGVWDGSVLIGFARVVSDGRFRAYIEDVLVLKEYRSRGLGTRLMKKILSSLEEIHVITLFCQPKLSEYYTNLGFKEFTKQVVMHMRNVR